MQKVPFENLDIARGVRFGIEEQAVYDKIVRRHRGGFCYELNGLFASLLRTLGFRVSLLSARVAKAEGGFGPDYDHMALLVESGGGQWLADVGFGDSFRTPLPIPVDDLVDPAGPWYAYRISRQAEKMTLWRRKAEPGEWEPQYLFSLEPREMHEFRDMCAYQQTSPESSFTRRTVCSLATARGRITLTADRLIETTGLEKREEPVAPDQWASVLDRHFGIRLEV